MWRCNAVRKAIHAWQAVKRAERQRFGSKSYFNLLDQYPDGDFLSLDNESSDSSDDEGGVTQKDNHQFAEQGI